MQIIAQSHQHVLQLATAVATAEGFESAAMNLCNELATRTGATRVTLGWVKGKNIRVKAFRTPRSSTKSRTWWCRLKKSWKSAWTRISRCNFNPMPPGRTTSRGRRRRCCAARAGIRYCRCPCVRHAEIVGVVTLEFPPGQELSQQASTALSVAVDSAVRRALRSLCQ